MTGRAFPDFDVQLARGQVAERDLREMLMGDAETIRIEVKREVDSKTHVFVEHEANGKPSGIAITKAERYAIEVYPHRFVVLDTEDLARLAREALRLFGPKKGGTGGLALGAIVPKAWLVGLE